MKTMTKPPPAFVLSGQVPAHRKYRPGGGVTIVTDAAVNYERARAGSGYVATSGRYGLAAHPQPPAVTGSDASTVAELRAVWRAVSDTWNDIAQLGQITILTDSRDALRFLRAWQRGSQPMPNGYQLRDQRTSGKTSSLEKLAAVLRDNGAQYTVQLVTGHAGDHLNEAADSLAKLALRTGTRTGVSRTEAEAAAATIVAARLSDYWETR